MKLAEAAATRIASGAFNPFTGPVRKQDGSVWIKEGEAADDGLLLKMDFFVAGVSGKMPG